LRFRARYTSKVNAIKVDMEIGEDLALLEERFRSRGMTSDEARAVARRAFGGVDQLKERHRDQRSFLWVSDMRRDFFYALRTLWRAPVAKIKCSSSITWKKPIPN
jgi:hypothetical protein